MAELDRLWWCLKESIGNDEVIWCLRKSVVNMADKMGLTNERTDNGRMAQQKMHKDFFDRCNYAIDSGFYMEAILMEYAAIEARLEVILGLLGLPCCQFIPDKDRQKINISHRIECISKIKKNSCLFENSKLPNAYFKELSKWIVNRNGYIHGLYKNEVRYGARMRNAKITAEKGLQLCKLLYNETGRIRRIINNHKPIEWDGISCYQNSCILSHKR